MGLYLQGTRGVDGDYGFASFMATDGIEYPKFSNAPLPTLSCCALTLCRRLQIQLKGVRYK